MIINVNNVCQNFTSYRASRVKSLFNAERGDKFELTADLPIEGFDWQIGLIVGPSGSGKTSIGAQIFGENKIVDLYKDWPSDKPIVDAIAPEADFNSVTGSLANVGLGDVPSWLRPFHALSNGQQFRAGLARIISDSPTEVVVDEFTSVIDRQIAKIGAMAFGKGWRRNKEKRVDRRMKNKLEALKAYEGPINESDAEIKRIREIEAVKLRHEIDVLRDLSDIVQAMYPNAK